MISAVAHAWVLQRWNIGGTLSEVVGPTQAALAEDRLLAGRILEGEEGAFEVLVKRCHKQVARISGRFFRRPEIVEELTQEIFVKAFIGMKGYRAEMPLEHWISRIAVNVCYDQLRRKRQRPETVISQMVEEPGEFYDRLQMEDAGNYWERENVRLYAEQLLAKLSPEERIVLTLMVLEDLPVADVARLTGWSVANVKIRAFRARARLRKLVPE